MHWNFDVTDIEILEIEDKEIHAIIRPRRLAPWMISGVYAKPNRPDKIRIFNNLESKSTNFDMPWLAQNISMKSISLTENKGPVLRL